MRHLDDNVLALDFLNNGESSVERCPRLLIAPDLFNGVLGGDEHLSWAYSESSSLSFGDKGAKVGPVLKMSGESDIIDIDVIDEDDGFTLVTIPPGVGGLLVELRICGINTTRFTGSSSTIDPSSADTWVGQDTWHVVQFDSPKCGIASNKDISGDIIEVTRLGEGAGVVVTGDFGVTLFRLGGRTISELEEFIVLGTVLDVLFRRAVSDFETASRDLSPEAIAGSRVSEVDEAL